MSVLDVEVPMLVGNMIFLKEILFTVIIPIVILLIGLALAFSLPGLIDTATTWLLHKLR